MHLLSTAGSFTTEETTTETPEAGSFTTEEITLETPEEPSRVPCDCNGLSSGSAVGIAVLAILLVVSSIINVIQFIVWRRQGTISGFEASKKPVPRCVSHEANENMAYEMIQTGDSAYTALKLGPSYSPIIAPGNVTFFTRLGSIGRGDFGEVWKGELRSNQSQVDVAIRQIPDQVTKSSNVLEAVSVLSELADQPNVVTCLGYCQEQGSILYEFISGGTLLTHLQTTGVESQPTYGNLKPKGVRLDEGSLLNLAWQIAKGMQFLGSKKIIHGTLCAHNVLLADGRQCKLSDYGLSSSLFSDKETNKMEFA
ncbi:tyrosine kinase receptor Cad96Ca-like [Strongylocentrotus purpuratus]|uniref:Protein kinase domain-containing protein n=1 Tax=Strongylocentrotus purpuratus TaxID=7668 RepID=A0A7M7P5U8_STRPU|nr:tyrosine kinase receptor Cad96Ca-like [Strongylocentrotus purpuratus]